MQKIVTITLNPTIDKSTTVKSIVPDRKLRCAEPKFEPGGGGVNVSRAIKKLESNSTAIYFAGGYSGKFFTQLLNDEGIESLVVPIAANTRENLIVLDESSNMQYRFGMPGPAISNNEVESFFGLLNKAAGVEYIVISGSLPEGIHEDFFARLKQVSRQINARLVADTSGEGLKYAINHGVYMIKPNLGELSRLNGVEELNDSDIVPAARSLIKIGGAEVIVVSMGPSGAILVTKDQVISSPAPTVRKRSTVGAGDTMVAGMVMCMLQQKDWKEVLQYGIAAGTATTMNPGTELCKKQDVERLFACLKKTKVVQ